MTTAWNQHATAFKGISAYVVLDQSGKDGFACNDGVTYYRDN